MEKAFEKTTEETLQRLEAAIAALADSVMHGFAAVRAETSGLRSDVQVLQSTANSTRADIALLSAHQRDGFSRVTETRIDAADIMGRLVSLEEEVRKLKAGQT